MQPSNKILKPTHLVIFTLAILISQSFIRATQGHAIDSSELTTQEISRRPPEQVQQSRPNVMWLHAKTAATSSETQLDQPPIATRSSTSTPGNSVSVHEPQVPTTTTPSSVVDPVAQSRPQTATSASSTTATSAPELPSRPETAQPAAAASSSTSTKSSWIESFLSNAESISSSEQLLKRILEDRVEARILEGDLVDSVTISQYVPSQAPTDSEEDPLEAPMTSQHHQVEMAGNGSPSQEANRSTDGISANDHKDDDDKDDDEGQASALLESNNVSAAVLATNGNEDGGGGKLNVIVTMATRQTLTCEQAYYQCGLRKVCAQALRVYDDECMGLISNWTDQCSARCVRAMVALRSSEEGDNLVNCDCQSNEYCLQNKNRSSICRPEVERAIQPKSIVSCSTASAICMADQLCSTAFDYYYQNCQTLFSQRHCSMRCNNSLAILYRQPKASKLIDCQCDGTEDFPCVKYKTYTERLCLNKHHTTTPNMDNNEDDNDDELNIGGADGSLRRTNIAVESDAAGGVSIEDDNQTQAANSEEDSLNLTNDSSDEYADDGIQQQHQQPAMAEDNWIPLVSGRFFTNLHQQQSRRGQQQPKVNRQRPHKQPTFNQQQQQRRPRNGTRQRGRPHEPRFRPHVFALASSSAATPDTGFSTHWQPMLMSAILLAINHIVYT